jgi:hypothetical protein
MVSFCFSIASANAQTAASQTTKSAKNSFSPVNGAWESTDHKGFAMMNDGFFSAIEQDSTGIWRDTHAGTYTMDNNNTMTLKILYSSFPSHVEVLHTVEYEVKGETLTMKWFKKLIDPKEGDITSKVPQGTQTQYTRMKK